MGFDVEGTTAIVTGANRGIGRAIATGLLAHGAAKVYAAVRDVEGVADLVAEHGDRVVPVAIDLRDEASVADAAATAGDVRLVVNNAGVLTMNTPLAADAVDALRFELDVNAFGLLRMARAFAPVLAANGGGAFVQLNSVASLRCFPPLSTYSASKAASYAITQGLRRELAEQGTAVLSVHPGPIETDMAREAGLEEGEPPSVVAEGIVRALAAGDFHLYPDAFARRVGEAYAGFAETIEAGGTDHD